MRETDRIPVERPFRDGRREGPVLWTSEQKIDAAAIFSCERLVVRIGAGRGRTETNHGVVCVGKEGPTASVDFFNDERIWNKRRFLL